jgi:hypothetical protein
MALIGPNGAGKTTAFNMITGVLPPTEGSVKLHGTEVAGKQPHIVAESAPPAPSRTCRPSRARPSRQRQGGPPPALQGRALRGMLMLDRPRSGSSTGVPGGHRRHGLTSLADHPIADLAFGKQRQVEVARALALEPSVLLLDEPMAGLSGPERDSLSWLLRKVKASGVTDRARRARRRGGHGLGRPGGRARRRQAHLAGHPGPGDQRPGRSSRPTWAGRRPQRRSRQSTGGPRVRPAAPGRAWR